VKWPDEPDNANGWILTRRGCTHGRIAIDEERRAMPDEEQIAAGWRAAMPVRLPGLLLSQVDAHAEDIRDALTIMQRVRDGESCADILIEEPYISRLEPDFDLLSAVHSGHDAQEIEKIAFDAVKSGELHAEDLWMKVSCLSFEESDDSIRFRFSYGMEMFKDQEDDPLREELAAELATRVFPECRMLSAHRELCGILADVLGFAPAFVERLIYSNAPGGGAQLHQDVEAGHFGVVYAQLFGHTAWVALPRSQLLAEIDSFLAGDDSPLFDDLRGMSEAERIELLESHDQGALEVLLNSTPGFTRRLVAHGHGLILAPGDALLLPQQSTEHCCWHSVFCLGDAPGHSLSFALARPA
jgi:hypothetical protein